jgi:hypothetical protein
LAGAQSRSLFAQGSPAARVINVGKYEKGMVHNYFYRTANAMRKAEY